MVHKKKHKCITEVDTIINEHKVVVFSLSHCIFCCNVKDLLTNINAVYTVFEVDRMDAVLAFEIQEGLIRKTKQSTFPVVFIKGKYMGGYDTGGLGGIFPLYRNGHLIDLLEEGGAFQL